MLANPFSLDGKVALVTGANSGLGREVALALRDAGALVAIGGRRTDRNARVLELLGNSAAAFQLDVSNEGSVERAVAGIVDRYGRWLVVQFTSLALAQRREMFAELLMELVLPEGIYLRTERDIGRLEGLELQVVTNSLHIVSALLPQQKTRVYLPAGALFREQNILLSPFEDDGTGHYQASKMFIGAAGVGSGGLMQTDVILLQAERRLMARAMSVVLMVDSSKFRGQGGQAVCELKSIGTIITDQGVLEKDVRMVKRAGVKLIVVDEAAEAP